VALDEDAFASPAANQRRLRTVSRHVAATSADERDDGVGRARATKPLLAFLETAVHTGEVEPRLRLRCRQGGDIDPSRVSLIAGAGMLRRRDPRQLLAGVGRLIAAWALSTDRLALATRLRASA